MSISPSLLRVHGLTKVFPDNGVQKVIFQDVNIDLQAHDSIAIVGPSGCGKTTLLLTIAGLLYATGGNAFLEGEPISQQIHNVAIVLQEYGLFPWKTAMENIVLGAKMRKIKVPQETLANLKQELGIEGLDHLYPHQLSGGQRQRVALARALLLNPKLLLLDEPFAALDTITREHVQNLLLGIFRDRVFSFILVTHNIEEAVFLGRRIIIMNEYATGIHSTIENPGMGQMDYREQSEFFQQVVLLRQFLKEAE